MGVDITPQLNYPFRFFLRDALEVLADEAFMGFWDFDAIHASPPCQAHTNMSNRWRGKGTLADEWPDLIGPTRELLQATGLPYVIENVPGAIGQLRNPVELTGEMFGLAVHRPRLFETNWPLLVPARPARQRNPVAVYGKNDGRRLWTRTDGSELRSPTLKQARDAMEMPWASWRGCCEAIPPAYTEFIGGWLMKEVQARVAA